MDRAEYRRRLVESFRNTGAFADAAGFSRDDIAGMIAEVGILPTTPPPPPPPDAWSRLTQEQRDNIAQVLTKHSGSVGTLISTSELDAALARLGLVR